MGLVIVDGGDNTGFFDNKTIIRNLQMMVLLLMQKDEPFQVNSEDWAVTWDAQPYCVTRSNIS